MSTAQANAALLYYWRGGTEREDPMEALALMDQQQPSVEVSREPTK